MFFKTILLFLFLSSSVYSSNRIDGRVVGVYDGDTITLLTAENKTLKIRLAQIDAPESKQAFGQKSKQSLSQMVFNKQVSIEKENIDRYGRIIGTVFVDGEDVNKNQVINGMAWVYRGYFHDKTLIQIEENARQMKTGLWSDPNPVPPWDYRRGGAKTTVKNGPAIKGNCGSKKYCKDMTSCDEAKQYLSCGISSLDKDGDGVPCESLCKK